MKVVIFGQAGFGIAALEAAEASGFRVAAAVATEEDGSFAELCRERRVPVFESPDFKSLAFENELESLGADLLLSAFYPRDLPARFLRREGRLALGLHPSLLPAYRGATPVAWALVNGDTTTGVTLYRLSSKPLEGDVLAQSTVAIARDDTQGSLQEKLERAARKLLEGALLRIAEGAELRFRPQDLSGITYFPPLQSRDALIKFDESTGNVHNRIRGTIPWPGAYTFHGERRIRILRSEPVPETSFEVQPGLIVRTERDALVVKTADGAIRLWTNPSLQDDVASGALVILDDQKEPLAIRKTVPSAIVHTRERYGLFDGAEEFPRMVVLATVYPCNARCPHCPYTDGNSDIRQKYADQPFIDEALFRKIADECGLYGAFLRITGGGEPLMHPRDMVSLIEYAKAVGARVWLNTNGSLLPPAKVSRLLACGLDQIEFSVDAGDGETYAVVRAGLDWENLVATVSGMVGERNRRGASTNIVVSVVEQEAVKDSMEDIVRFWKDLGVDEVMRRKFLTWGSNTSIDSVLSADPTPYLDKTRGEPCPYPFHRLNIDSRGKVEVCGYDISGRTNLGNVRHQTIREVWKGPTFEWWRRMHLEQRGGEIPLCRECPDWQYRSWTHNWEKVMRTAEAERLHAIERTAAPAAPDPERP